MRETRQLLVSPLAGLPSRARSNNESAENPPPLRRAPPQAKLQSSNDEITRLKIRLAAYEREHERRPEPKPERRPEPKPEPEPARALPKSSSAPAAAAARAARIDVAPDPDDDVWAFVEDERREFPRALPQTPANTPVQSFSVPTATFPVSAPTSNPPLRRAAFDPVATWADEENLVPPTRPRASVAGDTPRVAVRSGLRERSKNVSYAEPSLKAKVRRPWSPTKPKRRPSKAKRRETEAAAAAASTSTSTSTPTSTSTSTSTPSATSSGVRSFDAALARVASAVSFVTERKRGGAQKARRAKSPESSSPVESSPEIDPNALTRRGLTDSDSDPEEEPAPPDSDSPARPSPFSNFTSRHVKGPTNRVLSFDNSPGSNEPVPTAAAYVRIPTAVEIAPFRDDDGDSDGESEYEDAEGSAVDDDDVASDVASDVGDEVPLLARRLSQEEITDALLADAVATGMRLDPHPGARRGAMASERASASAASRGMQPSTNRKMRRSD